MSLSHLTCQLRAASIANPDGQHNTMASACDIALSWPHFEQAEYGQTHAKQSLHLGLLPALWSAFPIEPDRPILQRHWNTLMQAAVDRPAFQPLNWPQYAISAHLTIGTSPHASSRVRAMISRPRQEPTAKIGQAG